MRCLFDMIPYLGKLNFCQIAKKGWRDKLSRNYFTSREKYHHDDTIKVSNIFRFVTWKAYSSFLISRSNPVAFSNGIFPSRSSLPHSLAIKLFLTTALSKTIETWWEDNVMLAMYSCRIWTYLLRVKDVFFRKDFRNKYIDMRLGVLISFGSNSQRSFSLEKSKCLWHFNKDKSKP